MQQQEYDRQQRTLDGERAAISALAAKPQPPKEAQALAARIARFNVQVDAQNRRAAALNKGAESGQAEHDLLVARIDAYNARVDAINASRKALLADSSALAAKLAAYQAGCVGERQLLGK
jgi:chromosome segregation ATPase